MSVEASPADYLREALMMLARELEETAHGERTTLVQRFAAAHAMSMQSVYRRLRKLRDSGRRRRCDAGTTSAPEDAIRAIGGAIRASVRRNGKVTLHTPTARSILAANGHEIPVGNARINTLLRRHRLDAATQRRAPAHTSQRTLHPNQVHLVDPSVCLLYYLPDGGQGVIRDDEVYKNKPENYERLGDLKVWRYVLTDHYSGAILFRYYQARGEKQSNLWDFLLWCWAKREGRPFHGVPARLYWDKGSANTAGAIRYALRALQVETLVHGPGNARAKGQVEQANNLVECEFESRLKFEPVRSVEELNAAAEGWQNAFNANVIPEYDSRIQRRGMAEPRSRYGLWQVVRRDQLRVLPDPDICRYLLTVEPVERTVRPDLTISFKHPAAPRSRQYDVRDLPGVYPRAKVRVSPLMFGNDAVLVHVTDYRDEERTFELEPIAYDEMSGFRLDAPVIGEEHKRPPDTVADTAGKVADRAAYPGMSEEEIKRAKDRNVAPFGGAIDAHSHLHHVAPPAYLDRPGTDLDVPDRIHVETRPLSHIEACKRLVAELGRALTPDENATVRAAYPAGVPESDFHVLLARIRGQDDTDRRGLRIV